MSERRARARLVRHGETAWSGLGRHTGRADIPLTDRGRREAGLLAARLGARRFARVFTSPLRRAADTCRLAGFGDVAEPRDDLLQPDEAAADEILARVTKAGVDVDGVAADLQAKGAEAFSASWSRCSPASRTRSGPWRRPPRRAERSATRCSLG